MLDSVNVNGKWFLLPTDFDTVQCGVVCTEQYKTTDSDKGWLMVCGGVKQKEKKKMIYLTMHSTHFIDGSGHQTYGNGPLDSEI